MVLAHLVDHWAYRTLLYPDFATDDLGRMFRVMGYLPLWFAAGTALVLCDWPTRRPAGRAAAWGRGALIALTPVAGGAAAEVLKLVFRRRRPNVLPGEYVFRPWSERPFYNGGLGLPSSHALVAFSGAAILGRLFPRARVVWYTLAWGTAYSRVAAGAHYVSDVVAAWIVSELVVAWVWRKFGRFSALSQ